MSGKTHDVGEEHGKQAEKPMTCVFSEESKRKTQNREDKKQDKKRMRYENKERYI